MEVKSVIEVEARSPGNDPCAKIPGRRGSLRLDGRVSFGEERCAAAPRCAATIPITPGMEGGALDDSCISAKANEAQAGTPITPWVRAHRGKDRPRPATGTVASVIRRSLDASCYRRPHPVGGSAAATRSESAAWSRPQLLPHDVAVFSLDERKPHFDFLSPLVLRGHRAYLEQHRKTLPKHRVQDGKVCHYQSPFRRFMCCE